MGFDLNSLLDLIKPSSAQAEEAPHPSFGLPNGGIEDPVKQIQSAPADATLQPQFTQLLADKQPILPSIAQPIQVAKEEESEESEVPKKPQNNLINLLKKYSTLKNPKTDDEDDDSTSSKDALATLLGNSSSDLKSAQEQRNKNQLLAMLSDAGNTIGQAFTPLATTKVDHDFYSKLAEMANKPVSDLQQQQAMKKETLQNQSLMDSVAGEQEKADPNSAISKAARNFYEKSTGSQAASSLSAANLEKLDPLVSRDFQAEQNRLARLQTAEQNRAMRQDLASSQAGNKNEAKQNQALAQTQQLLESARGNPAVQQAQKDLYAADKAKSLINLYGDPNKLSPQLVSTLIGEVSKIATGGVPTVEGLKALTPDTLSSKFAHVWGNLVNNPTPANAGAFIKQYGDYTDALSKDARNVIKDKYTRVLEARKNQLGSDNYSTLKDQYLGQIPAESTSLQASSDTVQVVSPEGTTGTIPKANLEKAIARGFKLVNGQ